MAKLITADEAVALIPDGATIMFGGYIGNGCAHKIIDALSRSGKSGFTAIGNDAAMFGGPLGEDYYGIAKLVHNRQIKKLIISHIGVNPEVTEQSITDGTLETVFIPQGSLAEMIRAGGAGLGGVLTPVGVGTLVEDSPFCMGKQVIDGNDYLLMRPLHADIAVLGGTIIDRRGNIWYKGTTRNFNQVMATATDLVIAEADKLVDVGTIEPENVMTSGILVDYLVDGGRAQWIET